ncbi:MAG TPA: helix-turn-helix transcriptional regulator [Nakamurella sp.]
MDERIPEWDLADRLRKSLRAAGVPVAEMAEYLGVTRNTVGNWINGRVQPSVQTMRLWAMRTSVPYEWLRSGAVDR